MSRFFLTALIMTVFEVLPLNADVPPLAVAPIAGSFIPLATAMASRLGSTISAADW